MQNDPSQTSGSHPPGQVMDYRLRMIVDSYRNLTKRELLDVSGSLLNQATDRSGMNDNERARSSQASAGFDLHQSLWDAPKAIVAHGPEADPVFFYGNRLALRLFELDFAAFTRMPSRCSAEPLHRAERNRLLERVARNGFVDDYCGIRISSSGRRFLITSATVWNLMDEEGTCHGQAAAFGNWCYVDEASG